VAFHAVRYDKLTTELPNVHPAAGQIVSPSLCCGNRSVQIAVVVPVPSVEALRVLIEMMCPKKNRCSYVVVLTLQCLRITTCLVVLRENHQTHDEVV
jgi:hypothetical protein